MKCTHCGATITGSVCEYCGSELKLEDAKENAKIFVMDTGVKFATDLINGNLGKTWGDSVAKVPSKQDDKKTIKLGLIIVLACVLILAGMKANGMF